MIGPRFADDMRAVLSTWGALLPAPVRKIIAEAAAHIDALDARLARVERELHLRATNPQPPENRT